MPKATTQPRERGILYGPAMVRALLEGRKTQTRRVFANQPRPGRRPGEWLMTIPKGTATNRIHRVVKDHSTKPATVLEDGEYDRDLPEFLADLCPLGRVGDRLYVREAWGTVGDVDPIENPRMVRFRADWPDKVVSRWRPSIHLPRSLSRIVLTITIVRAERVQEITEADAVAEGVYLAGNHLFTVGDGIGWLSARLAFAAMWDRTNPSRLCWDRNPWTSVVTFETEVAAHG